MQGERDGAGSGSFGSARLAGLALVVVAALPLLAARLASLPLLDPDEAKHAYTLTDIKKWLGVFLFRFFQISQFKRSALPNGPKVVSGGNLSPRGDWRAPSDGNARVWLDELNANVPD